MDRWINEFSVMLIDISYNDALQDARIMIDDLEKNLKKLGYLENEYYIQYNLKEFFPGDKREATVFDKYKQNIGWEIEISIPTLEMEKNDALKIAEIIRFRIERICIELRHLVFQTINVKKLGYIKFNKCRMMLEDDEEKFGEMTI